ncbi:MAG: DUF4013 domain-containing protein [Caldilineaceae bacterium]|nr:DUF4013 domain-containing protein [Caldilineaceae bacterium]
MDIGRALTYFTEDERWVEKTAIGTGLLLVSTLLSFVLIGVLGFFILFGYLVRLMQNVRDDVHPALPEWNQWGDDLVRGVKLACVYVVWALPIILIFFPAFLISVIVAETSPYDPEYPGGSIGSIIFVCASCLSFLFGIAYAVMQPGFSVAFARNESVVEGLQASEIWEWTRDNIGNVVIVAILTVIASVIITTVGSIIGTILCVVGLVVTLPLSQLVTYYVQSHLYGQLARLAGDGAASGDFGSPPPAEDAPEDDAAPGMPAPAVVYDPQEEDEPAEDDEPDAGTEPAVGPEPMEESEPSEEQEEVVEEEDPAQEEGSVEEEPSDKEPPPEEPKSQ